MCYDLEPAEIWQEREVRARKQHRCELCTLPIVVGLHHTAIASLYEGSWTHVRVHHDCFALAKRIQREICEQDLYGVEPGDLRELVREYMGESPELLREYRQVLRARRTEGVWPARRAA